MYILGLDVSTTYVGVCVLDGSSQIVKTSPHIVLLDHIDFKKCNDLWEKADKVKVWFKNLSIKTGLSGIFIEDALQKFSSGASSMQTIGTLIRFNALVSFIVREQTSITPEFIGSGAARKLCGLKMQQKKKCGLSHKEQTFNAMMSTDLSHIVWPKKLRGDKIVDWAYDQVDSYVIAKAGSVIQLRKCPK